MDRKLTDAAALAGHLIPAGSMFAFLAAHRAEVFCDADYADLFAPPGLGRPSIPATQMAAVVDPMLGTRKSGEARRDGYRAHIAADPETGIITDEKLTGACGEENSDPAVAEEFVAGEAGREDRAPPRPQAAGHVSWLDVKAGNGQLVTSQAN